MSDTTSFSRSRFVLVSMWLNSSVFWFDDDAAHPFRSWRAERFAQFFMGIPVFSIRLFCTVCNLTIKIRRKDFAVSGNAQDDGVWKIVGIIRANDWPVS